MISVNFVNTDIFGLLFFACISLQIAVQCIACDITATSSDRQTAAQSSGGSRTVGYETRPWIGYYHTFVIGWSKYKLGLP